LNSSFSGYEAKSLLRKWTHNGGNNECQGNLLLLRRREGSETRKNMAPAEPSDMDDINECSLFTSYLSLSLFSDCNKISEAE
jgi:hypothetical protein